MTYLNHKPGSLEEAIANQTNKFREDSGYQQMFKKELEKAGKGLGSMTPAEKKAFFNKIDSKYKGKNENAPTDADMKRLKKMGMKKEEKIECPKCGGKGCEHCDNKGYHMKEIKEETKVDNLSDTIKNIWLQSAEDLEEVKKNAKYLKAQDVAPDNEAEENKKEGYENMVPNKKDSESDKKRKTTMTGEKPSKVEMEPEVKYDK